MFRTKDQLPACIRLVPCWVYRFALRTLLHAALQVSFAEAYELTAVSILYETSCRAENGNSLALKHHGHCGDPNSNSEIASFLPSCAGRSFQAALLPGTGTRLPTFHY